MERLEYDLLFRWFVGILEGPNRSRVTDLAASRARDLFEAGFKVRPPSTRSARSRSVRARTQSAKERPFPERLAVPRPKRLLAVGDENETTILFAAPRTP
jgi:hypothetical protein